MNSRVSWSVEGIEPSVRERAEAAARRAGMSLGDWINSTIGDAPANLRGTADQAPPPSQDGPAVAEIHQRLDSIARQIEQISHSAVRAEPPVVARQLNDAISRLDARLAQISNPAPARQSQQETQRKSDIVELAASQVYSASPPISPASLDFAVAEIAARQNELDAGAPRMPSRSAPPIAPASPAALDISGLEQQLLKITSQLESLRRPDDIEQSIAAFRGELSEIRAIITEAMPRRAIESMENEIRSLSRRIDDTRESGIDGQALTGVEHALDEIRDALRSLTPAEKLAGFDEAIRNLGGKIDLIVRTSDDPGTLQKLESAITALRAIVSNVASNDTLARLSDDLQALSSKVDQLAQSDGNGDSFSSLEQRIAALTSTLESRERQPISDDSVHLEGALKALSDRLDRLPVGADSASAFAHLEQRVTYLLERLETSASDPRSGNLGRVEEGLQDILRHLERQQSSFTALAEARSAAPTEAVRGAVTPMDSDLVDTIKRELSEMRFNQTETDRHTQDSLEVVHNTLEHVVDRLASIEGDLRAVRSAPVAPAQAASSQAVPSQPPMPRVAAPAPPPRPELPNPAAAQFAAAPRQFGAPAIEPAATTIPKTISDILGPPVTPETRAATQTVEPRAQSPRAAIDLELPPDHPLEPGTRPHGRTASPSERIAASEEAISEISAASREQATASNFIAAARRAAQAAAAAPAGDKTDRVAKPAGGKSHPAEQASTVTSKIRSILVGASVVVIVLGSFKMAMTLLDGGSAPVIKEISTEAVPHGPPPADREDTPAPPASPLPSLTSPTPLGRQSMLAPAPAASVPAASDDIPAAPQPTPAPALAASDATGTIVVPRISAPPTLPASNRKLSLVPIPASERLPDAIGGPLLRIAALKGDASAAYEVGVRYAEGKGVNVNYDEAAKWYERAAQAGVVPAIFRLGTLYEKGLSVKKDLDAARRYYLQAAERGNAKAMHNLAVLDADGGNTGANYKSASQWFRKAAERGVADSQFNLGILYARGIGVEQNLAESYKWFSLAAAQGDADAGRKRDDVAKRLDPQSLAAAQLAVQTFTPEGQPDDAVNVASPAGGWDGAPIQTAAAKAVANRLAAVKRASR
jgi:localization factor PodJL